MVNVSVCLIQTDCVSTFSLLSDSWVLWLSHLVPRVTFRRQRLSLNEGDSGAPGNWLLQGKLKVTFYHGAVFHCWKLAVRFQGCCCCCRRCCCTDFPQNCLLPLRRVQHQPFGKITKFFLRSGSGENSRMLQLFPTKLRNVPGVLRNILLLFQPSFTGLISFFLSFFFTCEIILTLCIIIWECSQIRKHSDSISRVYF